MIQPETYVNKPFEISAIQVTEENMSEVADWVKGKVHVDHAGVFIKVPVRRPLNPRQSEARVGDWVLSTGRGPKVYSDIAFHKGYELKGAEPPVQVLTPEESEKILQMAIPEDAWFVKPNPELQQQVINAAPGSFDSYIKGVHADAQNQGADLV